MRPIFYVIGWLILVLAVAMQVPMILDLAVGSEDWQVFAVSSALCLFFGVLLALTNRARQISLNLRQTFVLTTLAWVVTCLFSALPFMFSSLRLGFADAFFEAMSGLTTTGSTVIVGLGQLPPGLLMWRSLLQWLGGIGIVGMGIVILPFLRVGGMQLFRSESSDKSDKVVPRAADLAVAFGWAYLTLTVACALVLSFSGMRAFDAVNHAMTALATGGFSTQDASVGYWSEPAIHWTLALFMILGSLPFVRYISLMRGDAEPLWRDSQIRTFLGLLAASSLGLTAWLVTTQQMEFATAFRAATFNVVSVVTTTGYASADYTLWGAPAVAVFFVLTFTGGCTGSTAGGVKILRFEILWLALQAQMTRLFSPHRMMPLSYAGKPVDSDVILSVMSFMAVWIGITFVFTVLLSLTGLDLVTSVTGVAQALGNVGPGLGPIIGPAGNFAPLEDEAKWLLSLAMLLGRLELFTVLVLLSPSFWRT
ncbi:TrkH family potassium uptake protein [Indioceanicola profundi]|uniref:TrkH family potassium uptake protein n=1 Tax=Indioceanicola profundi TaxID=2220096 RepID=UPI001CEDE5DE|nr:TrkH family potassium uptake protein [Indioceanicola profundi]